jgi:ribosomal protein S18 acetylase RimI-like enzyme
MRYPSYLKEDRWLSDIIQRKAYHLQPDEFLASKQPLELEKDTFIQTKVPTEDASSCIALQQKGFLCIDTNVIFELKNENARELSFSRDLAYRFSHAQQDDLKPVAACARDSFIYTRYHLDPKFTKHMADTIKSEWAGNYFSGQRGQGMVLAKHDSGQVAGFCQTLEPDRKTRVIDLIAVAESDRRQGLAQGMILYDLGNKDLIVGTQVSNIPSIRCYESMGFKLIKSQYVFHFHGS